MNYSTWIPLRIESNKKKLQTLVEHWACVPGFPRIIHTDTQGRVRSKEEEKLLGKHNKQSQVFASLEHLQNEQAERMNWYSATHIKIRETYHERSWIRYLR